MTCCRKDYACLVGNFGCTGCILKPLVTAVAGVICRVAFLRASRSLCGNEGQIVRMRYGLVISAGVADVIAAVIVSRLVLLFVAARAFFPMIVCVLAPIACPCVPELCTCCSKGFCCADLSAGAALEIYCIVGAVGSRLERFGFYNLLIESMGMRSVLVGRFHAYCTGKHCESSGCAACVRKGNVAAYNFPLIKYLAGRSRICGQSNGCALRRFTDFASCANCSFTVCNGDVVLYCFVCYNNGFVFVHRNIQSIARYRCCSTVHRNGVDFIACIGGKGNRFG